MPLLVSITLLTFFVLKFISCSFALKYICWIFKHCTYYSNSTQHFFVERINKVSQSNKILVS